MMGMPPGVCEGESETCVCVCGRLAESGVKVVSGGGGGGYCGVFVAVYVYARATRTSVNEHHIPGGRGGGR